MGTESVVYPETLYGYLQQLVDGSDAGDTDGLEWVTGKIVVSKDQICQNLFMAAFLHLALAFALLLIPPSVINPNTLVLQVQLVSLAGNQDSASPGSGPPGDRPGPSEGGSAGTATKAAANPSEDRNADSTAMAQLIARTKEPDASEGAAPVPDEKPVVPDQNREAVAAGTPEALKNAATPRALPPSSAKKDARKTPSGTTGAKSETDRGSPPAPSCPLDAPQPGDQGQGETASAGPGTGERSGTASSSQGPGGSSGNGPFEARFGSPEGPRFLRKAIPNYPHQARQLAQEGTVVLHVTSEFQKRRSWSPGLLIFLLHILLDERSK
jgi:outer membrane biosynthesis protein TonB